MVRGCLYDLPRKRLCRKSRLGRKCSRFSDETFEENRRCSCRNSVATLASWPRRRLFHLSLILQFYVLSIQGILLVFLKGFWVGQGAVNQLKDEVEEGKKEQDGEKIACGRSDDVI